MSQVPAVTISAATPGTLGGQGVPASASASEKSATAGASPGSTILASASTGAPAPKLRSCVTCRTRKVRCDKASPCSNCRRAKIACVFPSRDRPPRWARRLDPIANNAKAEQDANPGGVNQVMNRVQKLESLVKELSSQLEQAHAAANADGGGSPAVNSPGSTNQDRDADYHMDSSSAVNTTNVENQFGRLVLQDASRSRYVSSGFWSRINDELDGLKMDAQGLAGDEYDSSEDEDSPGKTPSTQELDRSPSDRHAFLFRHNLSSPVPNIREYHPLPSQIPFLLNVYSENVNRIIQMVHVPTVNKMVRDLRGSDLTALTPANEALIFAIYYAAITSMEDDDVMASFGSSKSELNLKYRLGLEHALAKADFLNAPDIVLVQAFAIFLFLVRRHDSPRFVWMMTGLVIRMAQALGMHRDGTHFEHLTPYEVEMRRRIWWALCLLDMRASEDQGMDLTITHGSFDTKLPLNINDVDIDPNSKQRPTEREGISDMTFALVTFKVCEVTRQMLAVGLKDGALSLEDQSRLLNEIYERLDRTYLQYTDESGNLAYWVLVNCTRLVMAKMMLIIYLPVLFSSPSEHFSDEMRTKLFVAAIEVAEYNHALNAEEACRDWRWIFQVYTHWHAIVYLLIEITRRPWSPIVERAWVALHSSWLIPAQSNIDKNLRIWVPLRKLMARARKHRDTALRRLRADTWVAERLEMEDRKIPQPASPGPFPDSDSVECFRERWRKLVTMPQGPRDGSQTAAQPSIEAATSSYSIHPVQTSPPTVGSVPLYSTGVSGSHTSFEPAYLHVNPPQIDRIPSSDLSNSNTPDLGSDMPINAHSQVASGQTAGSSYNPFPTVPADWSDARSLGPGFVPWLWADADPSVDVFAYVDVDAMDLNMDLDGEVNWRNWLESAKGMELSGEPPNDGWT